MTRRRSLRWVVVGLAASCLASLLVIAPLPRLVSARELGVRTERIGLELARPDRSRDPLAPAQARSAEGAELRRALDSPGRRAARRTTAAHRAIGVGLPAAPNEPIFVRSRVRGAWTPWVELTFEPGEAPDVGTEGTPDGVHSEPVWMGDADAYELDAPGSISEIDVHLVAEGATKRSVVASPTSAGATAAPTIQPRSAWGAAPEKKHPSTSLDLKMAIVHHSVNSNTYSSADVPALIRSIQAYHQDVQGWDDIAYNFVVDRFGQRWEGRAGGISNVVVGGHSSGFNTGSVGVVVIGDFATSTVPSAAVESVAQIIAWKFALHRVNPSGTVPYTSAGSAKYVAGTTVTLERVIGHREVQLTSCPGDVLYTELATIRSRVAALVPAYQASVKPDVLDVDREGDGRLDPFEYQPGSTGDVQWKSSATGTITQAPASILGTYRPAVGDFDGDGRSDILWHGTGSASDFVGWGGSTGFSLQSVSVTGSYVPVVGDFDGNGLDDVFWYATGLAQDWVWYFDPGRVKVSVAAAQELNTGRPLPGDFNGDGKDDLFWYGPGSDADDSLWRSTGRAWSVTSQTVLGWYEPVVLDATADGIDDIVWYQPGASSSYRWDFTTTSHVQVTLTGAALTGRPEAGDFDGDGFDDVLVVAPGTAADEVWYSHPIGVDREAVTLLGTYEDTAAQMSASVVTGTDDVLYVSAVGDYLWEGNTNRSFTATKVG